ncbi:phosphonoacetaldehyde reductase [Kordiimonas sp.]|uniref:phosphonoacetaldehyde reductase n=1 Tax=Kordiimonas sp. TaxID=1970157 RepID=UPI003B522944
MTDQKQISWAELGRDYLSHARGIFLVAGTGSFSASGAKAKFSAVCGDIPAVRFSDFTENPQLSEISAGVRLFEKSGCDVIVAIGGGSSIDIAKSVHILAGHATDEHTAILRGEKNLEPTVAGRAFIAVPTTFGTGSESTQFAAVYIGDAKYSLSHPCGLPGAYVLDPALALSAPPVIRASTAIDALCQAIESYWAKDGSKESRAYAAKAIPLLRDNIEAYVSSDDLDVAANMAEAANLSGRAINISKTTAPHALSYGITKRYGVAHGQAVALTLPAFFTLNADRGDADTKARMREIFDLLGVKDGAAAKVWFTGLLTATGLKTRLLDITSVSADDAEELAAQVNLERLGNHPVTLTSSDLIAALLA